VAAEMAAMAPGTVQLNLFCMEEEAYKICEGWGNLRMSMELFQQMQWEGMSPHKFSLFLGDSCM
jgi:hypothetical protein